MTGRRTLLLAALLSLSFVTGCTADAERPSATQEAAASGEFWVDPNSAAAKQVEAWEEGGREDDARVLRRISEQAMAVWPAGTDPRPQVSAAVRGAEKSDGIAVLVAYNIPHRDCGQHSAGGASDAAAYREWIDSFAKAIGENPAIVVLEPDAVPHMVDDCTPRAHHQERTELLNEAVDRLKQQPRVKVYLDAGNPAWITKPSDLTNPMRRSGVARADGFSLNVSSFQSDEDVIAYGRKISATLDDKPFVIDSSRNGNGPLPGPDDVWCNPPGRTLGKSPTTATGEDLVDAYLWIKRPGESDGKCRGGPAAGSWWPEYALGLARNTAT